MKQLVGEKSDDFLGLRKVEGSDDILEHCGSAARKRLPKEIADSFVG